MKGHARLFTLREFKVEVTYRCPLNCVHCSSDARPSNMLEMPLDDCLRVLREAACLGAKEVAFSGGEPFCWPHLPDAVATAVQLGLMTTVYTAGNVDGFAEIAQRLHDLGVERFVFSVFGGNAISHERVTRVAGSLERTKQAIRDAHKIGLKTELHFVPMATNYRELRDVAEIARRCGASVISVLRLVPQGRAALLSGRALNRVQNLELRRMIEEIRRSGLTVRVGSPYNFLMLNDNPGCWAAIDRVIVGPDLHIYPCDAFKRINAKDLVGTDRWSCLRQSGLAECWTKSPYLEAIREYLMTDFEDPCRSCTLLEKCLSGCLAQKAIAAGTLKKSHDPDCLGPNFLGAGT